VSVKYYFSQLRIAKTNQNSNLNHKRHEINTQYLRSAKDIKAGSVARLLTQNQHNSRLKTAKNHPKISRKTAHKADNFCTYCAVLAFMCL